ncbi:MAG: hypothetical protein JHD15_22560, partial [Phenylobacterium sp.]|nr:hypothetical protein [Phenylobacterium sp.]
LHRRQLAGRRDIGLGEQQRGEERRVPTKAQHPRDQAAALRVDAGGLGHGALGDFVAL